MRLIGGRRLKIWRYDDVGAIVKDTEETAERLPSLFGFKVTELRILIEQLCRASGSAKLNLTVVADL